MFIYLNFFIVEQKEEHEKRKKAEAEKLKTFKEQVKINIKVLVLCEKYNYVSQFSSNLHVLRPSE